MGSSSNGKEKQQGNGNGKGEAFQRVKAEEWLDKKGARDNSYEATFGNSGWGAGAQAILGKVGALGICSNVWRTCKNIDLAYAIEKFETFLSEHTGSHDLFAC